MFQSPLGLVVRRRDNWGDGGFGAARTSGDKPRRHNGLDLITAAHVPVVAFTTAKVVREKIPYANSPLSGLLLEADHGLELTIFYIEPEMNVVGRTVVPGDILGYTQDLTARYPGITNHIHIGMWATDLAAYLDPTAWFFSKTP